MPLKRGRQFNPQPLPYQMQAMKEYFPQFKCEYRRRTKRLIWVGDLQPSDSSHRYTIKIDYKFRHPPHVSVISPDIDPNAPHMYRSKGTLCLYYPDDGDWSSEKLIAYTVVPWTAEWLKYYEFWCITGKWFGPEAPHQGNK